MKKIKSKKNILLALLLISTFVLTGCGQQKSTQQESGTAGKLSGEIRIDGLKPLLYFQNLKINVLTITSPGNLDKRIVNSIDRW